MNNGLIPLEYFINSIDSSKFNVIKFKDKEHSHGAPPHYYVTIPVLMDSMILISIITSQVKKREKYYEASKSPSAVKSLVKLVSQDFIFLDKDESVIDCNNALLLYKKNLLAKIDTRFEFRYICDETKFSEILRNKIIEAIKISPLVTLKTKKIIID